MIGLVWWLLRQDITGTNPPKCCASTLYIGKEIFVILYALEC